MPFKHFIQKIEGRLPEYTSANKPKFPYCFSGLGYDHQLVGFINGEEDLSDPGMIVTTNAAFLWRATPQGHDFWEEYDDYLFVDLPFYVQDIIYGWVEEFDVGEEVEFESVEENTEEVRLVAELERLREPLAVRIDDTIYEWVDRRGWIIRDA